jgi:PAS domain S-box-containing protein
MEPEGSERRLQDFAEAASDYFWEMDADLRFTYFSGRVTEVTGYLPSEFLGRTRAELGMQARTAPADWDAHMGDLAARRAFRNLEFQCDKPDGATVYLSISGVPVIDRDGSFQGYRGVCSDVTGRVLANQLAHSAHRRFVDAIEALSEGFVLFDADYRFVTCNTRYREMFAPTAEMLKPGVHLEDWLRTRARAGYVPAAIGREEEWIAQRMRDWGNPEGSWEFRLSDDRYIRVMDYRTASGGLAGLRLDITESRKAEAELRKSESLLRSIVDNMPARMDLKDMDGNFLLVNEAFARARGTTPEAILNYRPRELTTPEHGAASAAHIRKVVETGRTIVEERDTFLKSGERYQALVTKFPVFDENGKMWRIGSFGTDITRLKAVEMALRDRESQLRLLIDSLPVLIAYLDSDLRCRMVNSIGETWCAKPQEAILGSRPADLLGAQFEEWRGMLDASLQGQAQVFERKIAWPDGVTRGMHISYAPHIAADGKVAGVFCMLEDVTEAKRAQEQLRRSQRTEAVAQVTGGVAHEFNNLLMAITGNLELLLEDGFDDGDAAREAVQRVLGFAFRGKDLTGQLLSYTGNPLTHPEIMDLGEKVTSMSGFLRPVLGERITLSVDIDSDLWPVEVDPGEFEETMTNLALNARDAMPDGGEIVVTVTNRKLDKGFAASRPYSVTLGDYVCVTFSDTGSGMPQDVVEKAFDPFFTTKEVGKGTGLGLSMVYGFVHRQSGGYVDIDSEPGAGTTVTLYFPRGRVAEHLAEPPGAGFVQPLPGVGRTVLLVEDDPDVRDMLVMQLESWDYAVVSARDGTAALGSVGRCRRVDLLLCDVVLPGRMSGIDLAEAMCRERPELRVVLMSGYAREDLLSRGYRASHFPLLAKPYGREELWDALRSALAEPPPLAVTA